MSASFSLLQKEMGPRSVGTMGYNNSDKLLTYAGATIFRSFPGISAITFLRLLWSPEALVLCEKAIAVPKAPLQRDYQRQFCEKRS
jgi:hypothetical protein